MAPSRAPHCGIAAFTTQIGTPIRQVGIEIFARTLEILRAVIAKITAYFASPTSRAISPADLIERIRRELKEEYGYTEEDLEIKFRDQFGHTRVVELTSTGDRRAA